MSKNTSFRVAALAASIALAMSATSAMAATAPATQLPGQGAVVKGLANAGAIARNPDGSVSQVIDIQGAAVIHWGKGGEGAINADGTAGFNIGSAATLTFNGTSAAGTTDGVLNIDSSGNASQILGGLNGSSLNGNAMNVFVANANGVIVGASARIASTASSQVGFVGHEMYNGGDFNGDGGSLAFNGTGGDVTVQKGASIGAGNELSAVLVAGGNTVNVDLSAFKSGFVTLNAGGYDYNRNAGALAVYNDEAALTIAGSFGGTARIDRVVSGGDVSNSGTLDFNNGLGLDNRLDVAGTFTNTGTLNLIGGMTMDGVLANRKTVSALDVTLGGLVNDGDFNAEYGAVTINGDLANNGIYHSGATMVVDGDLTNNGQFTSLGAMGFAPSSTTTLPTAGVEVSGGSLVNNGTLDVQFGGVSVTGGDLTNGGKLSSSSLGNVMVINGNIVNDGELASQGAVATQSDEHATEGADYSITNNGTLGFGGYLSANAPVMLVDGLGEIADNGTTGSFTNNGTLAVQPVMTFVGTPMGGGLTIVAHDDINFGGNLLLPNVAKGYELEAVSVDNPLPGIAMMAANGTLTVSSPIAFAGQAMLAGQKVRLMADVTGVAAPIGAIGEVGAPTILGAIETTEVMGSSLLLGAGDKLSDDYAIRIGNGVTVSADSVAIGGVSPGVAGIGGVAADVHPNLILQGKLAGNQIFLGGHLMGLGEVGMATPDVVASVSDMFSGPNGGLVATGENPYVEMHFTGRVKGVPYLNNANFRYNGLPITLADADTLGLSLDPIAYRTNGTSNGLSAVNLLVGGNVALMGMMAPEEVTQAVVGGSTVAGLTGWQNTHLVLQSTGDIQTVGDFYWPGYVYLGTIGTLADGSAAPGTLGLGAITLGGNFSNVLPGRLDNGGGIHFISQFPLDTEAFDAFCFASCGGDGSVQVSTNANSWINFGTDTLTRGYANGSLAQGKVSFIGGAKGVGNVVDYGKLDASMFHTHAPDASR